jgi:hypothetical protein
MLDDGQSSEAIFNFMKGPPGAIDPMLAPDGTGGQPAGQLPDLWRPAFQPIPRTQIPTSHPARLTADQLTRTHDVPRVHGNAPSTYASMHELFDEGDLAQSIEHERPTDTISMMGNPSGARGVPMSHGNTPSVQADTPMIQDTDVMRNYSEPMNHGFNLAGFGDPDAKHQVTPTIETTEPTHQPDKSNERPRKVPRVDREVTPGGSTRKPGPRCAACVKSHKRCVHRVQMSPTPQPSLATFFATPGATANHSFTSGASNGNTTAVPTLLEPFSPLSRQAGLPTPTTQPKKAATARRKR